MTIVTIRYICQHFRVRAQFQGHVLYSRLIRDGHGRDAVSLIERISNGRRNLRHKSLIFALARCARCDDMETKDAAYRAFPAVCRTPTHLFLFVKYCEELSMPGKAGHPNMSRIMRKPDFCIYENKGADQLCSNYTADLSTFVSLLG